MFGDWWKRNTREATEDAFEKLETSHEDDTIKQVYSEDSNGNKTENGFTYSGERFQKYVAG